jgi:hypothetical protein
MSMPRLLRPLRSSIAGPSTFRPILLTAPRRFTTSRPATAVTAATSTTPSHSSPPAQSNPSPAHPSKNQPPEHEADSDEPSSDGQGGSPPPKSAYARFKLLTKKYGWYALGMYTLLSTVDFSLTYLTVHALGVERIEPLWTAGLYRFRVLRHGVEEADRLQAETERSRIEDKRREAEERKEGKKSGGYWGSRAFWAEVVLAYGIHKTALLPFRAGLTVAWTPKVVNWLASRGWIGKVSTAPPLDSARITDGRAGLDAPPRTPRARSRTPRSVSRLQRDGSRGGGRRA